MHNYIGATIFWLYIAAALSFSGIVIETLLELSRDQSVVLTQQQQQQQQRRKKNVTLFSCLAAISFTTLSINMLAVLIQSYRSWNPLNQDLLTGWILQDIGTWSVRSTLFQDFGEAIVASAARFFWAQAALGVTLEVCLYMAFEGTSRGIPRLWSFFCLAQILPISFAQNLFYIAATFCPKTVFHAQLPTWSLFGLIFAYICCLIIAPYVAGTAKLIPLILIARTFLFIPSVLIRRSTTTTMIDGIRRPWAAMIMLAPLVLAQFFLAWRDVGSLFGVMASLFEHPAVSALGCDFIISIASALVSTRVTSDHQMLQKRAGKMS